MKRFMFLMILLPITLLANEGAHHASDEIPWKAIFYQAFNFFLLVGILFFLLKDKVRAAMRARHDLLNKSVQEAQRARLAAEKAREEILQKLKNLEAENKKMIEQAKEEGRALKAQIVADAKQTAHLLEAEAQRMVENEVVKAKLKLMEQVANQALDGARGILTKSVEEPDQKRLQKEFVEKIEAVQ